jgi:hypothetical protein
MLSVSSRRASGICSWVTSRLRGKSSRGLANAGPAEGVLSLARTYDPDERARLGCQGVVADRGTGRCYDQSGSSMTERKPSLISGTGPRLAWSGLLGASA